MALTRRQWRAWVPDAQAFRRAGGRRGYNASRRYRALLRRIEVMARLQGIDGLAPRGTQAALAREFGVSPATISRDVRALQCPGGNLRTTAPNPSPVEWEFLRMACERFREPADQAREVERLWAELRAWAAEEEGRAAQRRSRR